MKINFVETLDKYRKDNNLTYRELGQRLNTTTDVAWDLLNNRRKFINLEILNRAMRLLSESEG